MFPFRKHKPRRASIRDNRPDQPGQWWKAFVASGGLASIGIATVFCVVAIAIVMLREDVVRYRPGQYATQDIVSRVNFSFTDRGRITELQNAARELAPRHYKANEAAGQLDYWDSLERELLRLPEQLAMGGQSLDDVPAELKEKLQLKLGGDLTLLQSYARAENRQVYEEAVGGYIASLKTDFPHPVILPVDDRQRDADRRIILPSNAPESKAGSTWMGKDAYASDDPRFRAVIAKEARTWFHNMLGVPNNIAHYSWAVMKPTYVVDEAATTKEQNDWAARVPETVARIDFNANQTLVHRKSTINERDWQILRAEQKQFVADLGRTALKSKLGLAGLIVLLTMALSLYVVKYQPRVLKNHMRAMAIGLLMLSMLLLAELAAIGTGPLYVFGIAPTLLVAMILAIAYDQRFALGVANMHALMVTAALDQGIGFYLILWSGVLTCCCMLKEVRSRSRLIEVGGMTALVMIAATVAAGGLSYDPIAYINKNCLYVGAAGLGTGFIVLGILPFIERAFRITTAISLLELADGDHPLLRRLAMEAPGTYNHSYQVAIIAQEAAEAIDADSLLCRVGAFYHDVGKMNKADYFVENQADGRNRHINLSPNVSLLIIVGHVKDGMEMAREYGLPTVISKFIEQHHGTSLVEYFYHQACKERDKVHPDQPIAVSDSQFRYEGPRPRSKEVAIVMLADCVESATRAMGEPTPSRIESLVHDLIMKRLHDGQLDECELTFRELGLIEKAIVKTVLSIYHGRISYPSTERFTRPPSQATPAVKLA